MHACGRHRVVLHAIGDRSKDFKNGTNRVSEKRRRRESV